ncbi:uncharacterized protein LOC110835115 isoform X2 [Zootermopsis nevadensis]|uniref:uncharacterized protein LOC110835115 isoform X2 n=1 Tax=Zootermopsis nevadensis TaxID=136037 RepID=UPI000B8E34C3|nr:uncharacterized protein LOC110835115 isoform X2 [Zootermopsis nevadensis]
MVTNEACSRVSTSDNGAGRGQCLGRTLPAGQARLHVVSTRCLQQGEEMLCPYEDPCSSLIIANFSKLQTHSVFGGEFDAPPDVTSCPLSKEGLACRQAEARRIIDNCPGGDCEGCDSCDENRARTWPHCCQYKSLCCSELAKACQICKVTSLQTFCKKYFKRCF